MKIVEYKNKMTGERLYATSPHVKELIDGVEFITVTRQSNPRAFLMRKDALEKVGIIKNSK
jgi:hypothetical protein